MEFTQNHEEIIIIRNESVTVTTINFNSVEILKIDFKRQALQNYW